MNAISLQEEVKERNLDLEAANEDRELLEMIREWEAVRAKAKHDVANRLELLERLEALEGRIRRRAPCSFLGVNKMLDMAFTIAAARQHNPDSYLGEGPLLDLISRIRFALERQEGACW